MPGPGRRWEGSCSNTPYGTTSPGGVTQPWTAPVRSRVLSRLSWRRLRQRKFRRLEARPSRQGGSRPTGMRRGICAASFLACPEARFVPLTPIGDRRLGARTVGRAHNRVILRATLGYPRSSRLSACIHSSDHTKSHQIGYYLPRSSSHACRN